MTATASPRPHNSPSFSDPLNRLEKKELPSIGSSPMFWFSLVGGLSLKKRGPSDSSRICRLKQGRESEREREVRTVEF